MTNLPFGDNHVTLTLVMIPATVMIGGLLVSLAITAPQVVVQRERHVQLVSSLICILLQSRDGNIRKRQSVCKLVKYVLRLIDLESTSHSADPELAVRRGPHLPLTGHVIITLALEVTLLYLLFIRIIS